MKTQAGLPGKLAELVLFGLLIGLVSLVLSFLWRGYTFLASDAAQHLTVDLIPPVLPQKVVLIDVGEQSCREWAKQSHGGICALLPRLPHGALAAVFKGLEQTNPKLVVVDIDLQSEAATTAEGPEPYSWPKSITADEEAIRQSVLNMAGTPFLVAQPMIRTPDTSQSYDYYAAKTILHGLEKTNLFFGHVEQAIDSDGVMRRFPATLKVRNPGQYSPQPVPHLALKACEALTDAGLCGREPNSAQTIAAKQQLMFGSEVINANGNVQFRYVLPRDVTRLFKRNVISLEAVNLAAFDPTAFDGAIVFLGSTARGRKEDYHFTPLNVFAGETAGIVIVMNEVLAALLDKPLKSPSLFAVVLEKLVLILLSAVLIFILFWKPFIKKYRPVGLSGGLSGWTQAGVVLWFALVVLFLLAFNALAIVLIWFYSLAYGEIADPVTPVVAVIFDVVVDISAIAGHRVAAMADKHWAPFWERIRKFLGMTP